MPRTASTAASAAGSGELRGCQGYGAAQGPLGRCQVLPGCGCRWTWCPNAADTGGLVADDWETVLWDKVEYLQYIGLRPWYLPRPASDQLQPGPNNTLSDVAPLDPTRPDFTLVGAQRPF